jgi:single-strand DNA-binding protein
MSHINSVTISGALTRDPELVTYGTDGKLARLGVAVERQFKAQSGDYEKETSFFDVTVFGNFGDLIARKLRKADKVTIAGRLQQQTWEQDGAKRSKVVIIANDVDSQGLFRSKDEETAPATADTSSSATTEQEPAKDDIPF